MEIRWWFPRIEYVTPLRILAPYLKTLSASAGNLIAVYEETNPERIVVLHDFSEGKSWPRGAAEENDAAITRTGEGLLKKLQQEYANSNLTLNVARPVVLVDD